MHKREVLSVGLLLLGFASFMAGCGSKANDAPVPPPDYADRVKKMLSGLAESGDRQELPYLRSEVTILKNSGDPQGAALLADVDKLEKTTDPAQFKKLAAQASERVVVPVKPPESP